MILTGVTECDSGSHEIRGSFLSPCSHQSFPFDDGFPRGVPLRGQANHLWVIEADFPQGHVLMSSSACSLRHQQGWHPCRLARNYSASACALSNYYLRVSLEQITETLQPCLGLQQAVDFAGCNSQASIATGVL